MQRALRERLLAAMVAFGLLLAATALLRDPARVGLSADYQWDLKFRWHGQADCVLAGDSRVAYGLSPERMSAGLDGRRVLNFAFPFGMYTDEYLDAIEAVLDPASQQPTILLGLTERSLVPVAQTEDGSGFEHLQREDAERDVLARLVAARLPFTSPSPVDRLWREMNPLAIGASVEVRYPDGWTAQAPVVCDRSLRAAVQRHIAYYTRLYERATVDEAVVEQVLGRVRTWTARGIRVYGWRPPTAAALRSVEERLSGFDEETLARRFEAAGGVWIPVAEDHYQTYDGSHLHRASAERISQYIAGWIRETERARLVQR